MRRSLVRLFVACVPLFLLLGCPNGEVVTPPPGGGDEGEGEEAPENRSPEVTLEFLEQAIEITLARASGKIRPPEAEGSIPGKPPPPEEPGDPDPPKGAAPHARPSESELQLVEVGAVRQERAEPKRGAEEGREPLPPPEWRRIGFASGVVAVEAGIDERLFEAADRVAGREFTYALVILDEYLTDPIEAELSAAGVEILGPHASAYKARLPVYPERLERIAELPYVYWLGYPPAELKLDRHWREATEKYGEKLGRLPALINLFHELDAEAAEAARQELARYDIVLGPYDEDLGAFEAVVPLERLPALLDSDLVLYVELQTPDGPAHDRSAPVMGADYIRTGGPGTNFTGSPIIVGILDTGFMVGSAAPTTHDDLWKFGCGKNFTNEAAGVWDDQHGHGTHVLGTFGGTGAADSRYRGVATGIGPNGSTRIRAGKIWQAAGGNQVSWALDGMDYMADASSCDSGRPLVVNKSGGGTPANPNGTDARSRKLDAKSFDHGQAWIMAAGNEGGGAQTLRTPATAKNAITVGNVRDSGFQQVGDIWGSSSRGPTSDGRMKPNVVATGRSIRSANAGTTDGYVNMTGTSMAAPHVAGISATLLHHYDWLRGRPYLLRAHLMATAILHDDTVNPRNNSGGGRNTYGLGRVSTYASHWARPNANGWSTHLAWRTITNSSWGFRDIDVPAGTDRLVVVMTWDEDSASSGASDAVEYDLDLWIDRNADCVPDAKGQCGEWASQSWDDNVEYLIVDNPPAGTYRLKIINWDAPGSGLPAGLAATVIRGDPTPSMTFTATVNDTTPDVGDLVTVTTTVSSPSYVTSGVFLEQTSSPPGLARENVTTTREDGVTMNFTGASLTLGNVVQGDSRSAAWAFRVNSAGTKTVNFRAWSENGGTVNRSVTITASP